MATLALRQSLRHAHRGTSAAATSSSSISRSPLCFCNATCSPPRVVGGTDSRRWLATTAGDDELKDLYEHLLVEKRYPLAESQENGVAIIQLNRPRALNALCDALFDDLLHATRVLDRHSPDIGAMVITSSTPKAFAAGADIAEMSEREFANVYKNNMFAGWAEIGKLSKPTIGAINGFALGGGCELAMMLDILVAGPKAKFGQPEINLGVLPGAGGTQRLTRAVGKSRAMEMVLTGASFLSAQEALERGLVSRVCETEDAVLEEAVQMALVIASKSQLAVKMAKEATLASMEMSLEEGLKMERRLFQTCFGTNDQKEGMAAFMAKREPNFTHT